MRIGFLINEYPIEGLGQSGGIGTCAKILGESLVKQGHEVIVYGWRSTQLSSEAAGVKVCFLKELTGPLAFYRNAKNMQRQLAKDHLDLVEVPDWSGFGAFISFPCPLIVRLHGSDTFFCEVEGRKVRGKNKYLEAINLRKATGIIAVSDYVGGLTKAIFGLSKNSTTIHNGIQTGQTVIVSTENEHPTILYFGAIVRKKGVFFLPDCINSVLAEIPTCQFILAGPDVPDKKSGNPSTWEMVQSEIESKNLKQVRYVGALSHPQLLEVLKQTDICLLPSLIEAFPMAWLEAMSFGKPIIGLDKPWAREVLDPDISGILCDEKTRNALAEQCIGLIQNPRRRAEVGEQAQLKVKEFSMETITAANVAFYKMHL